MTLVSFQHLSLQGFGPYEDRVDIELKEGLNNYVAENERGKSSLVNGLLAILFGIPQINNPQEFGQARFRNWNKPKNFEGTITFKVGKTVYRIIRDFSTNEVAMQELTASGYQTIVEGVHNPRSIKPNQEYEAKLKELLHINSRDLFTETFCVTQPFPQSRGIDDKIQSLLTGGEVHFASVLNSLAEEIKSLTRYTRSLNIETVDQRKDRQIELLEKEIKTLETKIEEDRETVDSLERIQKEIDEIKDELTKKRAQERQKNKTLNDWSQWRQMLNQHRYTIKEQQNLNNAVEEAQDLQQTIKDANTKLSTDYEEFLSTDPLVEDKLDELVELREQLRAYCSSLEELSASISKLDRELTTDQQKLASLPNWSDLGDDPASQVKRLEKVQQELYNEWQNFNRKQEELTTIENELKDYESLAALSASEREKIKNFKQEQKAYEEQVFKAKEKLNALQEKQLKYEDDLKNFKDQYKELENIPTEAQKLVEKRIQLTQRETALTININHVQKKMQPPLLIPILAAIILAGIAVLIGVVSGQGDNIYILTIAGVAAAIIGYFAATQLKFPMNAELKNELIQLQDSLTKTQAEMDQLKQQLGSFGHKTEAELGALKQQLISKKLAEAALKDQKAKLPTTEEITAAEEELKTAKEELAAFNNFTAPFKQKFSDLEASINRWQNLLNQREVLTQAVNLYARGNFNSNPENLLTLSPYSKNVKSSWAELADFFSIAKNKPTTMEDLIKMIERSNEQWWHTQLKQAEEYSELKRKIDQNIHSLINWKKDYERKKQQIEELSTQEKPLAKSLQQVLALADGDAKKARQRYNKHSSIKGESSQNFSALKAILRQYQVSNVEELKSKKLELDAALASQLNDWQRFVKENPELPQPREDFEPTAISDNINTLEKDLEDLKLHLERLMNREQELIRQHSRLQGHDPINIAQTELILQNKNAQHSTLKNQIQAASLAYHELKQAIVDFQSAYRSHLEDLSSKYFQSITGQNSRTVAIDEGFNMKLRNKQGQEIEIEQLSKGAQDQLYLALRFAIADLLSAEVKLPFIFDDPFVACDEKRLNSIHKILENEADNRQFLMLSHDEDFSTWGFPIKITKTVENI